jgi:ATP-dependent DNA ligase
MRGRRGPGEVAAPAGWPRLALPIVPPYPPMEARRVEALPSGEGWLYEPKWDGFRCLAFRDGDTVALQSKAGQPLARYFPEVVAALQRLDPCRFVLDGEVAVATNGLFDFDALLQRIHPSESRVRRLAAETPAVFLVFDLLVDEGGRALVAAPLAERRRRLETFAARWLGPDGGIRLSPATTDCATAAGWLRHPGDLGLDGVVAKRLDAAYASGERTAMQKVKRLRTADCVVGGFRWASRGGAVGSLLLGLYDDDGRLHHVGFTSSFRAAERAEVLDRLRPLMGRGGFTGRAPGGPSRWATERTGEWEPVEPRLVCEVRYDHWSGDRFRHGTTFLRWRPDKAPEQCTFESVRPAPGGRGGRRSPAPTWGA